MSDTYSEAFSELAERFRNVVETATEPVMHDRERGHHIIYFDSTKLASVEASFGEDKITYARHIGDTAIGGIQGLDFVPSHSVEIDSYNTFFGSVKTQTMFGLREDEHIVRSHMVRTDMLGPIVVRELDQEETSALVDFASSPIIHQAKRSTIFRLTPEEATKIAQGIELDKQAAEELQERLREIDEARRRGAAEAANYIIF